MLIIKVTKKTSYGVDRYHPACKKARIFTLLTKTETLTKQSIERIKALGFIVELVTNNPKKL